MNWRDLLRGDREASELRALDHALSGLSQTHSDSDQTAADEDTAASTADREASQADEATAQADQGASDADQLAADREARTGPSTTATQRYEHEASRRTRSATTRSRAENSASRAEVDLERAQTQARRFETASLRDEVAAERDHAADLRDGAVSRANQALLAAHPGNPELRLAVARHTETRDQGLAARRRAAADRQRAAEDRLEAAAAERQARADVQRAQLDNETGVFAFDLGHSALRIEIDRCRRHGDSFVLAHVAVDLAGTVGAGQDGRHRQPMIAALVRHLQEKLRGYDAVVRIEPDEFLCGLPGTSIELARKRFDDIRGALDHDASAGQLIVGFAALAPGDDLYTLTDRATADLDDRRNGPR